MGIFDKAKDLIGKHDEQVGDAIDKGVDMIDDKTGGKLGDKADVVADKAKDALGIDDQA